MKVKKFLQLSALVSLSILAVNRMFGALSWKDDPSIAKFLKPPTAEKWDVNTSSVYSRSDMYVEDVISVGPKYDDFSIMILNGASPKEVVDALEKWFQKNKGTRGPAEVAELLLPSIKTGETFIRLSGIRMSQNWGMGEALREGDYSGNVLTTAAELGYINHIRAVIDDYLVPHLKAANRLDLLPQYLSFPAANFLPVGIPALKQRLGTEQGVVFASPYTAFIAAILAGHFDIAELLIANGAIADGAPLTGLTTADWMERVQFRTIGFGKQWGKVTSLNSIKVQNLLKLIKAAGLSVSQLTNIKKSTVGQAVEQKVQARLEEKQREEKQRMVPPAREREAADQKRREEDEKKQKLEELLQFKKEATRMELQKGFEVK